MSDKVQRLSYWTMEIPDKAGEAWKVLAKLEEASVNLLSFTAFPSANGKSQLVLVPETIDAFLKVAREAKLPLSDKKEAFFFQGADRPGVVATIVKRLASAGINIHAMNATSGSSTSYGCILWVKPEAFAAAAKALAL